MTDSALPRRHVVQLSDRDIDVIDRALRGYFAHLRQVAVPDVNVEAHAAIKASGMIQFHKNCDCSVDSHGKVALP